MSALRRIDVTTNGANLAFGAVTVPYATLITVQGRAVMLVIVNSLDASCVITLDGGTGDHDFVTLGAGQSITLDFGANNAEYTGSVRVRQSGAAPTAGAISCGVVRVL